MAKGRKPKSAVRDNILTLLIENGPMHGYQIYKEYVKRFGPVTLRLIYYHLKKGIDLGEIAISHISEEEGPYSWGPRARKVYYKAVKM